MENQELYIPCDGIRVHAKLTFPKVEKEKYPLLILIPGLTGHIEETHILAVAEAANRAGFACLRAELFGHGLSEGRFYDHNVLIWMTEVMRVVDYSRNLDFVTDLYLAGHSQGGLTAVLGAGLMRDRLKAVIPLSPALNIYDAAMTGNVFGQQIDIRNLPEDFVLFDEPEHRISSNYLRAARMLPLEASIRDYTGPVLIVHGTADETVPYAYGEQLAQKYANARLVSIPDDDHCYDLHLDAVAEAVESFLREMEGK